MTNQQYHFELHYFLKNVEILINQLRISILMFNYLYLDFTKLIQKFIHLLIQRI